MKAKDLALVLQAIEFIVGDDQCELWGMENATRRFRGRSALMHAKLSQVYRIAHSGLPTHECYDVHDNWRVETTQVLETARALA